MTALEIEKQLHIKNGFYTGTPLELVTYETVKKFTEEIKLTICYGFWLKNFDAEETFDWYVTATKEEFEDTKDYYDAGYTFEDYLNDLTYSHLNEIWGTPMSLV